MSTSIPYRINVGDEDGVRMSNMNPEEDLDDIYGVGVVMDCNSGIGSSNVDVVAVEMEDGDNDVGMVVIGTALVLVKEEDVVVDDVVDDDAVGDNVVTIDIEMEVVSDNDTGVLLELVVVSASASDNGSDGCSAFSSIFDNDEVAVGASVVVAAVGDIVGISSFTSLLSALAQPLPIITVSLLPYFPSPLWTSTPLTPILYPPLP
jgi:hypothetical protein